MSGEKTKFCPACYRAYPPEVKRCAEDGTALVHVHRTEAETQAKASEPPVEQLPLLDKSFVAVAYRRLVRPGLLTDRWRDLKAPAIAHGVLLVLWRQLSGLLGQGQPYPRKRPPP